jgi:putative ABC transport system ATP-binding protein
MATVLSVAGLNKVYGSGATSVRAIRDVSFETKPGEFIAIVGPSGSGKTTLLAMIGGLLTPTSGAILVNGRDIARLTSSDLVRYRRESVGFVFQANNLVPYLTGRENLLLVQAITGGNADAARRRAGQLLDELGISGRANALATELSGGERQRVAIGRALMNDPQLVLVDEPTANLDSQRGRQVVQSLIDEVRSREKLGIMVTHDMEMAAFADRVLALHDGELSQDAGLTARTG